MSHVMCIECGFIGVLSLAGMLDHYYRCKGSCVKCGLRFGRVSVRSEFQALVEHQETCNDFSGYKCGSSDTSEFLSPARHFYFKSASGRNKRSSVNSLDLNPHPRFLAMLPNTLSEGKLRAMFETFGSKRDPSLGHQLCICSGSYTCGFCDDTSVQVSDVN